MKSLSLAGSAPMYICLCNGFTDHQVRRTAEAGSGSVSQLYKRLGCAPKCGKCVPVVRDLLRTVCCTPEPEQAV
jgi:bacterioferritin-associated ferredoxin